MKPPTRIETALGNLGTEAALTAVAALTGSPLAALLPVLSASLASGRQKQRVEIALADINATLEAHGQALTDLTDAQYKLVNEAILALLHTTSTEKIEYLRSAVRNCLTTAVAQQEAVVLSRILRDISADEAAFLIKNFSYDRIQVARIPPEGHRLKILTVPPDSADGLVVTGLVSLGLLAAAEPVWDESGLLRFSPVVAKLLVLLR